MQAVANPEMSPAVIDPAKDSDSPPTLSLTPRKTENMTVFMIMAFTKGGAIPRNRAFCCSRCLAVVRVAPLFLVCVCRWTLSVSNGCPTTVDTQPAPVDATIVAMVPVEDDSSIMVPIHTHCFETPKVNRYFPIDSVSFFKLCAHSTVGLEFHHSTIRRTYQVQVLNEASI